MPALPDPRWANIVGAMSEAGEVRMIAFEDLEGLASEWAELVPSSVVDTGPGALLRMARSLFAHAWFDYEFMVVACLVGLQAMEAAFRLLYPDAGKKPVMFLVRRAQQEDVLPESIAELAERGVELRNSFSHPATQSAFTLGLAAPMLENTHRMVALIMAAAGFLLDEGEANDA